MFRVHDIQKTRMNIVLSSMENVLLKVKGLFLCRLCYLQSNGPPFCSSTWSVSVTITFMKSVRVETYQTYIQPATLGSYYYSYSSLQQLL